MMFRVFAVLGVAAFAAAVTAAQEKAPDTYKVKLDTSKGPVVIEVHRSWAPIGADHLYNLVKSGFYNDVRFFRVEIDQRVDQMGLPRLLDLRQMQPVENENVWPLDGLDILPIDIVGDMGIKRHRHAPSGFDGRDCGAQRRHVIGLGKALAHADLARRQRLVVEQKPVGRDDVDARVFGPSLKLRTKRAREGAFACRHAA